MDDLLDDFVAETREMLEAITGELISWEQDPADRARLDSIFRFVHTVKGNCGFFDFPRLEALSHAAESALADVRAGRRQADKQLVSAVLGVIDRIAAMTDAIEAGNPLPDGNDQALIAAVNGTEDIEIEVAPAAATGPVHAQENSPITPRTIRLPVELLDRVMSGVSDMVLARNDLARRLRDAGNEPTLDGPFERLSGILTDVREAITRMRMQRIEHLYQGLPRLVRDLSEELGKNVMIDAEGGAVELDREMIEMIRDPITHLIRNSVDHGIETAVERETAQKPSTGLISITSRQSGNKIAIALSDDGAGLDVEKIGQKAVAAGLLSQNALETMPDDRIFDLIFEAGLSTSDAVSGISGRGVGMDVVRSNIEKIGGTIEVRSTRGEGTTFVMHIPLTLSIISALTVSVGEQAFAIPHSYVAEIAHGKSAALAFSQAGETDLVTFRENRIPCLTLGNVLGLSTRRAGTDQRLIMLKLSGGETFALAVDQIYDQEDLVIKPLAPAIMDAKLYGGSTLRDDGQPILMLDIPAIARTHGLLFVNQVRAVQREPVEPVSQNADQRTFMTFVDLHGRSRAVAMDLVTRIEQINGEDISVEGELAQVVIDGRILTLSGIDGAEVPSGQIRLLRLSDGDNHLGFPVLQLGQSIDCFEPLEPHDTDPSIEGIALLEGKAVPVIDGYSLFARFITGRSSSRRLTCALPEGDEWANRLLAPLISAAGYTVIRNSDFAADVTIVTGDRNHNPEQHSGPTIYVHSDVDKAGDPGGGIYRYDRTALLEALRRAQLEIAS